MGESNLNFIKMQAYGNDFVIVNGLSEVLPSDLNQLAKEVCNRRFGVGADTFAMIIDSKFADIGVRFFNNDGSEAEMCGNGIRCITQYLLKHQMLKGKNEFIIETLAGNIVSKGIYESGKLVGTIIDMGVPRYKTSLQDEHELTFLSDQLVVDGTTFEFIEVSMGNPHCIIYVPNVHNVDINSLGPKIERHIQFPNGTNVEFVEVINEKEVKARIWERGGEEPYACGTGACAIVVAGFLKGTNLRETVVRYIGGEMKICWSPIDNHVYMTSGLAEEVFTGNYY